MGAIRLLWSLFHSLAWLFWSVCSRAGGSEVVVASAQVTEAPQLYAGQLDKRDSPLCGYINGDPGEAMTCSAPNDCYFFTTTAGFYAYKAACGTKGVFTSYIGPYGLCVNFNAGLCPNVASCSSQYGSVLFCASRYPYCIRYEMRDNPLDPSYYVMLDCATASILSPIQIYFTPTSAAHVPTVPTTPTPSPIKSTIPSTTTSITTTSTSTSSTTATTTTTSTTTSTPPAASQGSTDADKDQTSSGLSVGDKAAIAGSVIAGVTIITGFLSTIYKQETRRCLSCICCCLARPYYNEIPMNHI